MSNDLIISVQRSDGCELVRNLARELLKSGTVKEKVKLRCWDGSGHLEFENVSQDARRRIEEVCKKWAFEIYMEAEMLQGSSEEITSEVSNGKKTAFNWLFIH